MKLFPHQEQVLKAAAAARPSHSQMMLMRMMRTIGMTRWKERMSDERVNAWREYAEEL